MGKEHWGLNSSEAYAKVFALICIKAAASKLFPKDRD